MATIVAKPHPLKNDSYTASLEEGASLLSAFGNLPECVIAQVDGRVVSREEWSVPLGADSHVAMYSTPEGGDIGRAIAMIAVAVAAAYTGGLAAAGYAGTTATVIQAGVTAAVTFAGSLAVNALIPPKIPSTPEAHSSNIRQSITGVRNTADPYGVVPRVYGNPRWYPKLAANPITEIAGNDQFLRMVVVLGYGPLEIDGTRVGPGYPMMANEFVGDAIRIGETNIDKYEEVEWQIGTPSQISLDYANIDEEAVGANLNRVGALDDDEWVTDGSQAERTTSPDTKEISIDLVFPNGVFCINSKGSLSTTKVRFEVEYRPTGTGSWTVVDPSWTISGPTKDTKRVNKRWKVPKGQYDVRVIRKESYHGGTEAVYTDCQWATLRSIQSGPSYKGNHVLMGLRIRATDQLNGAIDQLNIKTQSVLRVYNGSSFSYRATSNPAWAYLDALTGSQVGRPVADTQLDIVAIREWALWCENEGLEYHWVHDSSETVMERARTVAAAGQASFALQDGLFGVVRDDPDEPVMQVITPRNATGFSSDRQFKDLPHGLRVKYVDPDTWTDSERIVYRDGYNSSNATRFEDFETQGVASAAEAYHHGNYNMRQAILRPETFKVSMDWENLVVMRGNRVLLAYDVIKVGLSQGRVKHVQGDLITLDTPVRWEPSNLYGLRVREQSGDINVYTVESTVIGDSTILEVVGDSHTISEGDLFAYGELDKETFDCKVQSIQPGPDFTADLTLVPSALDIYDYSSAPDYDPGITNPIPLDRIPPPMPVITSVRGDESSAFQNPDGSFKTLIRVGYSFGAQVGLPSLEVEARYRVEGETSWTRIGPFSASGILTIDNVREERYEIQLRGKNGVLYSGWSQQAVFNANGQQVSRPTSVDLDEHTFEIVILPRGLYPNSKWEAYWSEVPLAEGDITSLGNYLGIAPSFIHTGLEPDTIYYYYIRGWSADYTSAWLAVSGETNNNPSAIMKNISGEIRQNDLYSDLSNNIDALNDSWVIKVDGDGKVGGIGLAYSEDQDVIEFGIRADRFYIVDPDNSNNETIPFIFEDGALYLDKALITDLTIEQLQDDEGTFVFQDGKLQAEYIAVNQIYIDYGQINNVNIRTADIDNGQITNAKIANAAISQAKIQNAAVDTLQIRGQAVTIPVSSTRTSTIYNENSWTDTVSVSFNPEGGRALAWFSASVQGYSNTFWRWVVNGSVRYEMAGDSPGIQGIIDAGTSNSTVTIKVQSRRSFGNTGINNATLVGMGAKR